MMLTKKKLLSICLATAMCFGAFSAFASVPESGVTESEPVMVDATGRDAQATYSIPVTPYNFVFSVNQSGTWRISTSVASTLGIDTKLYLYNNSTGAQLAYDDDSAGNRMSQVDVSLTAGTQYRAYIVDYYGGSINCFLNINLLSSGGGTNPGSGTGSSSGTISSGNTYVVAMPATFTFRPTSSGTYTFTTSAYNGMDADPKINIYQGSSLLSSADDNNGGNFERLSYYMYSGTTYSINIQQYRGTNCRLTISGSSGSTNPGGSTGNTITVWNSDSTQLSHFPNGATTMMQYRSYSSNTRFDQANTNSYMSNAAIRWRNAGISVTHGTSGVITYRLGSTSALWDKYQVDMTNRFGLTRYNEASYSTQETVQFNGSKQLLRYNSGPVRIYVRNDKNNRGFIDYDRTFTHELGHALGFHGHNTTGGTGANAPVMQNGGLWTGTLNATPLISDTRHILQGYNRYASTLAGDSSGEHLDDTHMGESYWPGNAVSDHPNYVAPCEIAPYESLTQLLQDCSFVVKGVPQRVLTGEGDSFATYDFNVTEFIAGGKGETTIKLRTQFGDVLSPGQEYMIAGNYIDSVYGNDPLYVVFTGSAVFPVDSMPSRGEYAMAGTTAVDLKTASSVVKPMPEPNYLKVDRSAMDANSYIKEMYDFADVVFEIRVDDIVEDSGEVNNNLCQVFSTLGKTHKGTINNPEEALEYLALSEGVVEGQSYLVFMKVLDPNESSSMILAAKDGAIISVDSIEYTETLAVIAAQ